MFFLDREVHACTFLPWETQYGREIRLDATVSRRLRLHVDFAACSAWLLLDLLTADPSPETLHFPRSIQHVRGACPPGHAVNTHSCRGSCFQSIRNLYLIVGPFLLWPAWSLPGGRCISVHLVMFLWWPRDPDTCDSVPTSSAACRLCCV